MGTNPFAINIPPASTQILPNDMVQLGQLLDMGQQRQLRALQVEQLRRRMADIESLRQQGGPFQSLQGLSGTVGQPQQPSVAIPPVTSSGAVPEGQVPSTSMVPGEPSSTAAPVPPPVQPDLSPSEQRRQAYESLMVKHPYAWQAYGKDMMELEKMHLVRQQSELEMHKSALGMLHQSASEVMEAPEAERPALWADRVNMFKAWGIPGMENVDPGYEPGRVRAFAAGARSASERVAQQQNGIKLQIESLDAMTKRHEAETKEFQAKTEARRTEPYTSAQGLGVRPVFPGAPGAPTAQGLPAPAPGSALPEAAGQTRPMMLPDGTPVLIPERPIPGQTQVPGARVTVPPNIPAYSAQPGAPGVGAPPPAASTPAPQTGLETPEMYAARVAATRAENLKQLEEPRLQAEQARTILNTLDTMTDLLHQGIYTFPAAKNVTGAEMQKFLTNVAGKDREQMARTATFQTMANQLVTDMQSGKAMRVGPQELSILQNALGALANLPPHATIQEQIATLRKEVKKNITHYNSMAKERGTMPLDYTEKKTMSKADFEKHYADIKASGKSRADFARFLEGKGYDVEGVY